MNSEKLGQIIKNQRKSLGLTQTEVALSCGVGIRFISDLENGKPSCQIEKALLVIESIGLKLYINGQSFTNLLISCQCKISLIM
jgi:y4mF family transcriptional regulator